MKCANYSADNRLLHMPCTCFEDVHVICRLVSGGRGSASTGGGWRRTCAWRERRWPSFIIWRWAGPAQAGWIRCRWRTPPPRLPPPDLHPSMTSMSPPRLAPVPPRGRRAPRRDPGRAAPGRPAPANRRSAPREPRSRPGRAPGRRPSGAGPQRGSGPRRAAGGARGRLALVLQTGEGCRAVDQCNVGKGLREVA